MDLHNALQLNRSLSWSNQTHVIAFLGRRLSLFARWSLRQSLQLPNLTAPRSLFKPSLSQPAWAPLRALPTVRPRLMELWRLVRLGFGNGSPHQRRRRTIYIWNWNWLLPTKSWCVPVRFSWWTCSRCLSQRWRFRVMLLKVMMLTTKLAGLCPKTSAATKVFTQAIASAASPPVETGFGGFKRWSPTPVMDMHAASVGRHSSGGRFSGGTSAFTPEKNHTRVQCARRRLRWGRASAATWGSTQGRGRTPACSAAKASVCERIWKHTWGSTLERSLSVVLLVERCSGLWRIWRNTSVNSLFLHSGRLLACSCGKIGW